jgi:hypothetical protein
MAQKGGAAQVTTDHEFIKEWVEARGGCPAAVKRTSRGGSPGIIRIDYPGFSGQKTLEAISWDEFFQKFDEHELAFLYQEQTADGQPSRFSKIVGRETAQARQKGEKRARRSAGGARGRQARASSGRTAGRTQRAAAKKTTGGKKAAGAKGRTRAAAARRGAAARGGAKTAARGASARKAGSTRKASSGRASTTRRAASGRSASRTRQPSKARKPQGRGARKPRSR